MVGGLFRGFTWLTVVVRSSLWVTGAIRAPAWLDDAPPVATPRRWGRWRRSPGSWPTGQAVVAARAGTGLTLVPLTALRVLRAPPPVTRIDLVWGTRPLATSTMVDRLTCTGLGGCASDPQDRRHVQLAIADHAKPIVGDINLVWCLAIEFTVPYAVRHESSSGAVDNI